MLLAPIPSWNHKVDGGSDDCFADAIDQLQPDLFLILGDRFEVFAAATAAMVAKIPIAHCHGGELTEEP